MIFFQYIKLVFMIPILIDLAVFEKTHLLTQQYHSLD